MATLQQDKETSDVTKPKGSRRSVKSNRSSSSRSSSHSATSILLETRAKAESAEAKISFIKKEAEIKRQVASLQADMEVVQAEKEAAIAVAQYNSIKDEMYDSDIISEDDTSVCSRKMPMLKRFLSSTFENADNKTPNVKTSTPLNPCAPKFELPENNCNQGYFESTPTCSRPVISEHLQNYPPITLETEHPTVHNTTFIREPMTTQIKSPQQFSGSTNLGVSDLSNYLIKRDLLVHSCVEFSDNPESYQSWKNSFHSMISDLNPTAREEFDLLLKHLGPESKKQAISIKCAYSHSPTEAVKKLWSRLEDRYGSPVLVETALNLRLISFPDIGYKDMKRLYDLADLLAEIQARMNDPVHQRSLRYFDSSSGMRPIIAKLPYNLQEKWTSRASSYNQKKNVSYPPFCVLVDFINEMSKVRNDPGFVYYTDNKAAPKSNSNTQKQQSTFKKDGVHVKKTSIDPVSEHSDQCMLHSSKHSLNECKSFQKLTINERKKLLKDYKFCFRCCSTTVHSFKDCKTALKCHTCGRTNHATALHVDSYSGTLHSTDTGSRSDKQHGGESPVVSKCTAICGKYSGRSCSKTILVNVYPENRPDLAIKTYALLDDQSNSTLAKAELFDSMNVPWSTATSYSLLSCAGRSSMTGRHASNFTVESYEGSHHLRIPKIIECNEIPNERSEIATPDITSHHRHLSEVEIPPLDNEAEILLLIGRDVPEAHHVHKQCTGPKGTPFAQKMTLGWVLVGNVCLNKKHPPEDLTVLKTTINKNGHRSIFEDCKSSLKIEDQHSHLFTRVDNDNILGPSVEDRIFVQLMNEQCIKDRSGHWMAPLPFRTQRHYLPNNKSVALKRAMALQASLRKNPVKCEHFITFMKTIFDCGYAEKAYPIENTECWYLPIFGVYHSKKPDKIRVVFDSSCKHEGTSLNDVLLQGPDLLNRLDGVLLRFRKEPYAIIADIEQMFFQFLVNEPHRNYLRFLWHRENNPKYELEEYRMRVHVFGNSPSPSVATYGLHRCVNDDEFPVDSEVKEFVSRNFYVDDGLSSFPTVKKAVEVLQKTQKVLFQSGKLRLHKIASNSEDVMSHFPSSELAKTIEPLELNRDDLPLHHSLGLSWELSTDTFTYKASHDQKPYTKRGILSTVNGLFDPLGLIAPVVLQGKLILRDVVDHGSDWDELLPPAFLNSWKTWVDVLTRLSEIHIPRCFIPVSYSACTDKTLHIFCDASEKAISSCAYLRGVTDESTVHVGFVFGKSKVAPKSGHTIPRLELCASVLAVEIGEMLSRELDMPLQDIHYYSDSNVVLGYISNERRRFFVYVSNRVARIHKSSTPDQWNHVPTDSNPADQGTRGLFPEDIMNSQWLNGPAFLHSHAEDVRNTLFPLVNPDTDEDIRPEVKVLKTLSSGKQLGLSRFKRFSSWKSLLRAIKYLRFRLRRQIDNRERPSTDDVERVIIKLIQQEHFEKELSALRNSKNLPSDSKCLVLSPFLDEDGFLRVGGRLKHADMALQERMPLLIPGTSYIAKLLVLHYHENVRHQGRHITEGSIRSAGLWITGVKRLVANVIHHCVVCRKLRGKNASQKMADLPKDRLTMTPPFTYVGVDVFGPWEVSTRRTRGGSANSKRWAVLFTCLYSRAVHIELVEEMSTSSFINAMRRFVAIRGKVTEFRSDRGTNFVGAVSELKLNTISVDSDQMLSYLEDNRITWHFNPPHASHFGGVWERMIGVSRRILDAMLLEFKGKSLTHEVLATFMAEVSAIINSRPIVPVSTDPDMPFILTPGTLLTQKTADTTVQFEAIDIKDIYRSQWKTVQLLANTFWKRWKNEFLSSLQPRKKWTTSHDNLKPGDIVLLRDKECARNDWPTGLITQVYPSEDGLVRKLEIRVMKNGKSCTYQRPVCEVVPLLEA